VDLHSSPFVDAYTRAKNSSFVQHDFVSTHERLGILLFWEQLRLVIIINIDRSIVDVVVLLFRRSTLLKVVPAIPTAIYFAT